MAYLVVLVLDKLEQSKDVLEAWSEVGATGITILESTGIGRLRKAGIIDNLPLMPSLRDFWRSEEVHHRTLFSVVESESTVDALVAATRGVVGDLHEEETGLLFVVPVTRVYGLQSSQDPDQ